MTFIELTELARTGDRANRVSRIGDDVAHCYEITCMPDGWRYNQCYPPFRRDDILANDWAFTFRKEKRIIVHENIIWKFTHLGRDGIWYPDRDKHKCFNSIFDNYIRKPPMKMTLEWEE